MEAIIESALLWIIGAGVGGLLLGTRAASFIARSRSERHEIERLTAELAQAETALDTYRAEVFEEFAQTAVKFKALNDSYSDLHQQLARSASVLCGEPAANALLEEPGVPSLEALGDELEVEDRIDEDDDALLGDIVIQEAEDVPERPADDGTEVPTLDEAVDELSEVADDVQYGFDQPDQKTG
ncbi:MAG: DUF1043 family protein [Pseudomonadales bacterium]|jgi:uncharacterized membrane-anchored protein YhcB (DUF1043 family)|nr:DUF1043 family protein [Pseudomonadales bacterium]MDP6472738.1 DUF1043 family protein [Pseudomonadales bacterium]MDP6827951.1 DUF1043 family protein [Pseudomonadales bacterium]MDP6973114.1 DUF1043 family protein [Pseudomonadales bacterium]|tara:strand:- start:821 stop:1372 length:552 start_codon:yes stop_codon:yes gene_type:complete